MPLPTSAISSGALPALETTRRAVRAPAAFGVKRVTSVHMAFGASVSHVELTTEKSAA